MTQKRLLDWKLRKEQSKPKKRSWVLNQYYVPRLIDGYFALGIELKHIKRENERERERVTLCSKFTSLVIIIIILNLLNLALPNTKLGYNNLSNSIIIPTWSKHRTTYTVIR